MTVVKEREPDAAAISTGKDISLEVTARGDVATGVYEVSVKIDNESKGSSYVLTSPRNLAFRRAS